MRSRGALSLALVPLALSLALTLACRTSTPEAPRADDRASDEVIAEVSRAVLQSFEGAVVIPQSGHANGVTNLLFDADGGHLLSVGRDESARLWDLSSGAAAQVLTPVSGANVRALDIRSKQVVLQGITGPLNVWDLETARATEPKVEGHDFLEWTRDASHASHYDGRVLRIWERQGDALVEDPDYPSVEGVQNLEELLPGPGVALQQWDGNLRLQSLRGGKAVLELSGLRCTNVYVPCYAIANDGQRLAVVTSEGMLRAYDQAESAPAVEIDVGQGELMGTNSDGTIALTLERQVAKLYDLESKRQVGSFRVGDAFLSAAALAPDGSKVAVAGDAGIWVFDSEAGTELFRAETFAPAQSGAVLSEDGTRLLLAYNDFERQWIETWDLELVARTNVRQVDEPDSAIVNAVLPGLLGWAGEGRVWWHNHRGYLEQVELFGSEGATKQRKPTTFVAPKTADAMLKPAHGKWMVLLEQDHVRVFSSAGTQLGEADLPRTGMNMAVAKNGFVVADVYGAIHTFEVGAGLRLVRSTDKGENDVFVLGDGSRYEIAAKGQLRRVGVGGETKDCGEPIDDVVEHLAASPDGRWVVTKRFEGVVDVWDCKRGQHVYELDFPGELKGVDFAAKAPVAVLTGNAGTAAVVKLDAAKHLTLASNGRDWVALRPGGTFAGSGGAARLVAASDGVHARSIDQYALHLNRPDKLMQWWGAADEGAIGFYKAVAERRLGRAVRQVAQGSLLPPEVGLRIKETSQGSASLEVSATDPGGALTQVQVFVDGVPAATMETTGGTFSKDVLVELTPGRNLIEVSASNAAGLESARRRVTIDPTAAVQAGQLTLAVESPRDAVFSPDGETVTVLDRGGMLRTYRTSDGATVLESRAHAVGGALAASPDGKTLFTAGWDGDKPMKPALAAWSASDGKKLRSYQGVPLPVADIFATSTHVAVTGAESRPKARGGFAVWKGEHSKPLWTKQWEGNPAYELVPVGSEGVMADMGLLGLVGWQLPGDAESLNPLRQRFDPVLRVLGVSPEGSEALVENYEHELRIVEFETGKKVGAVESGGQRFRSARWIDDERLIAWGSEAIPTIIDLATGRPVAQVGTRTADDLVLSPDGARVAAMHYDGIDLLPLPSAQAPTTARLYFVGIGVSDYDDDRLDLGLAAIDATKLATAFAALPGFTDVRAKAFVDDQVGRAITKEVASFVADAGPNDTVVLFIAGHGKTLTDADPTYYFLPSDADVADLRSTGVPFAELEGVLGDVEARKKLLLLDTCESGEPDSAPTIEGVQLARTRGLRVRGLEYTANPKTQASASSQSAQGAAKRKAYTLERDRFVLRNVQRRTGAVIFSAAGASEYALEDPELGHGLFTAAILEVLGDGSGDSNRDGSLDLKELERAVSQRVRAWSDGYQNPRIDRENIHARISFPTGNRR